MGSHVLTAESAAIRRAYSKRLARGRVISETPKAGTVLPKSGKVGIVVSRGARH